MNVLNASHTPEGAIWSAAPISPVAVPAALEQIAASLRVSCGAVLAAACHVLLLRTSGPGSGVVLQVSGPDSEVAGVQIGLSAPAVSEDDSFAAIARAVQAELDGIPFRRDLLDSILLRSPATLGPAAQPLPGTRISFSADRDGLLTAEETKDGETETGLRLSLWHDHANALQWPILLNAALRRPDEPVARLPMQADAADLRWLAAQNATGKPFPSRTPLHVLITERARATPDVIAVEDNEFFLSYAQLEAEANRLAAVLRGQGIGPGGLVGVSMQRSWRLPGVLLAILKTGAAYVPLDPAFPADRILFMVQDCGALAVITDQATWPDLPTLPVPAMTVESLDHAPADPLPATSLVHGILAYVIYTSGSTGQPKGVQVRHDGVVNLLCAIRDQIGFTAADRLLAVSSISFDISVLEIFLPLLCGGTTILASRDQVTSGTALAERLASSHATICQATPVTWRMLLRAGWQGAGIKILCGGEAVEPDLARALIAEGGGRFWNVYGPTETTIWSTLSPVSAVDGLRVPIGRPIDNTRLYVLDADQRRVPPGALGELWIGGVGVAEGYLNRPDLTADRFRVDPFATAAELFPGELEPRMYRTGDRARILPDGGIEFHGRVDHQIKLRGFRIELGEIEAALSDHPAIHQAVAAIIRDADGEPELAAYIVPRGTPPSAAALREHVRASLPDYMVPTRFLLLDSLPLTPNGKVDRKLLPADAPRLPDARKLVPARDETEAALVQIWSEVLGINPVGVEDDFFALGGHSLRAVRLLDLVQKRFGVRLHLNTLYFQGATPAYFATILRNPAARPPLPHLIALQAEGAGPPLFCLHTLGNVGLFHYRLLAEHLRGVVPVHGINAVGHEDGGVPSLSVPDMAAHALQVIRAEQPRGPYRLCGFSSGGLVAYELARMLRALGEDVETLILLDSEGAVGRCKRRHLRRRGAQVFPRLLGRELALEDGVPPGITWRLRWSHRLASWRYRPGPYGGKVLLFASAETLRLFHGEALGWDRTASQLEVRVIATDHDGMVREPAVQEVAAELARRLAPDTAP